MSLLNIYKASAGSGKTYRLSLEFLKYVIQDPTCFERILAVTFTNKATAEMKTRIITNLYGIAKNLPESKNDIEALKEELAEFDTKFSSDRFIVSQAQKALSLMLHNYSHFHIETIDSFFQTVLRTLEKELGLGTHMNVELEPKTVLTEAAEALLDDIPTHNSLRNWVQQYLSDQLENDRSWRMVDPIVNFGNNLFSENFKPYADQLFEFLNKDSALSDYKQKLLRYKRESLDELAKSAQRFFDLNVQNGFSENVYFQKIRGIYGYFKKMTDGACEATMNSYVLGFYEGDDAKLSKDPNVLQYRDEIYKILDETEKLRTKYSLEISTIDFIVNNIFQVGLLHYLDQKVRQINAEKNQFILSDTQGLLNVMVKDEDTPFIYEKIGTFLDHIMIDEFQDTSETQWANFKPLISECASRNMSSLIVGDPKQSIYRFRNGKWELMGRLKNELPSIESQEITLDTNWRSELHIVHFNNKVFSFLPQFYTQLGVVDESDSLLGKMVNAYSDATQLCHKEKNSLGYVKVQLIDGSNSSEYNDHTLHLLAEEIKNLQMKGIQPEQMAILIRSTKDGAKIADYFAQYKGQQGNECFCFDLISEEAYRLDSSETIQAIISALRYIASLNAKYTDEKEKNQKNLLAQVQLIHAYQKVKRRGEQNIIPPNPQQLSKEDLTFMRSIADLQLYPLYEMVEEIYRIMDLKSIPNQENYYCYFLDRLNDFLVRKSSNLRLFLSYWDDKLHGMTIPSGESNGIRIMTIHKSKGLEFHTVLIPFCDWEIGINSTKTNYLWEGTSTLPELYRDLPCASVKIKKEMVNSHFKEAYFKETVETYMDNLNILYVALTRAEKNMFIIGKQMNAGKNELSEISHLLHLLLKSDNVPNDLSYSSLWQQMLPFEKRMESEDLFSYELGELVVCSDNKAQSENPFNQMPRKESFEIMAYSQKGKFRQSNKSNDFIEGNDNSIPLKKYEYITRGKLLHAIFSKIASYNDVESVLNQMVFDGLIHVDEKADLQSSIQKVMETPEGKEWFRPNLKLYNECSILFRDASGELQTRRPDRVIRDGNKMIVIDFKFGKESSAYNVQIDEYVDLLRNMGYEAEGHIWYLQTYFQ